MYIVNNLLLRAQVPGEGHGNLLSVLLPGESHGEETGRLRSTGSQRVRHNRSDLAQS